MPIVWDESMSTGVHSVDNQHKELFAQLDGLREAMHQGKGREKIGQMLDFLGDYAVRHFATEERAMDQQACPAAAENKRAHADFLAKFKTMRGRLDQSGTSPAMVLEMHEFLSRWLVAHIKSIDTKLAGCAVGS